MVSVTHDESSISDPGSDLRSDHFHLFLSLNDIAWGGEKIFHVLNLVIIPTHEGFIKFVRFLGEVTVDNRDFQISGWGNDFSIKDL